MSEELIAVPEPMLHLAKEILSEAQDDVQMPPRRPGPVGLCTLVFNNGIQIANNPLAQLEAAGIPYDFEIRSDDEFKRIARVVKGAMEVKKFAKLDFFTDVAHIRALLDAPLAADSTKLADIDRVISEAQAITSYEPWTSQIEHIALWRTWFLIDPTGETSANLIRRPSEGSTEQGQDSPDGNP